MAIVISPGFQSTVADNPDDFAAGLLTPSRHNLACTITGLTANALLSSDGTDLTQDATNLLYTTASGPRLQVGSGSTTLTGLIAGYSSVSGYAAIWPTGVTPSSANYVFLSEAGGGDTRVNGASVTLFAGNVSKLQVANTNGLGASITAGTATTDVNALSATQTLNAGAVNFTHEKHVVTEGASGTGAATSLLDYQYGTSGAETTQFKVRKDGLITTGGTACVASFGPAAVASITVKNGLITAIS